jgi:ATP-dependent Clp protease ATP-binding subunit ClpB
VEGLARRIVSGDVPEGFEEQETRGDGLGRNDCRREVRGEFEDRLKAFLKEVTASEGRVICSLTNCTRSSARARRKARPDAANMLKPQLARGELRCVGATTLDEYRKHIEKDPALERRFQPVMVLEPTVEATIAILRGFEGALRGSSWRSHSGFCARRGGDVVAALHHRAFSSGQSGRSHR